MWVQDLLLKTQPFKTRVLTQTDVENLKKIHFKHKKAIFWFTLIGPVKRLAYKGHQNIFFINLQIKAKTTLVLNRRLI